MNSTRDYGNSSQTPAFFFTYDQVYNLFGFYYYFTIIYTVLCGISVVSFALNLTSLWILSNKREFQIPLYTYMRVYSMSCTWTGLTNAVSYYVCYGAHFNHWYNLYWTGFFGNFVYFVFFNTGYLFATLLDIMISLDRIALFNSTTKKFLEFIRYFTAPYKVCFLLYLFSLVVAVFSGWISGKESITLPMEGGKFVTFWYTAANNGVIDYTTWLVLSYIIYICRDILTLVVLIILSIVLIVMYRNYHLKRVSLFRLNQSGGGEVSTGPVRTNPDSNAAGTSISRARSKSSTVMDKKLVAMTGLLCLFGVFEHVVAMVFLVVVLTVLTGNVTTLGNYISIIWWLYNLAVNLKQCSSFFLLLGFNTVFRNEIKRKWNKLRGRN